MVGLAQGTGGGVRGGSGCGLGSEGRALFFYTREARSTMGQQAGQGTAETCSCSAWTASGLLLPCCWLSRSLAVANCAGLDRAVVVQGLRSQHIQSVVAVPRLTV